MAEDLTPRPGGDPHGLTQDFQHTPVAARVPEKIGRGVFSSATMILQTGDLFVIDFLSMMVQPQQVVARVVLTSHTFAQFLNALKLNVANFERQFGLLSTRLPPAAQGAPVPQPVPVNPAAPVVATTGAPGAPQMPSGIPAHVPPAAGAGMPPPITELYEQLKFPEDLLAGAFANAVMIRHTPEEFCFDFISSFYPRPVVTARVFLAAGRIPSLVDAMHNSLRRYQQGGSHPPPSAPPMPPQES
jgi:hypothetical protein